MARALTSPMFLVESARELIRRDNLETLTRAEHSFASESEALKVFERAKRRMLAVDEWGRLTGYGPVRASFALFDHDGKRAWRAPVAGDFVRLHLPPAHGPAALVTGGADWLRVEHVGDDALQVSVRLRPTWNPTSRPPDDKVVVNYLTDRATWELRVDRAGHLLTASLHAEHEYANTDADLAGGILRAQRNRLVAWLAWGLGVPRRGSTPGERLLSASAGLHTLLWRPFVSRLVRA